MTWTTHPSKVYEWETLIFQGDYNHNVDIL